MEATTINKQNHTSCPESIYISEFSHKQHHLDNMDQCNKHAMVLAGLDICKIILLHFLNNIRKKNVS